MAYQPVIDLVTQALEHVSTEALRKLPPVALAEIAGLVPALAERVAVQSLSADFPQARQARLFQAIVQLFEAAAGGRQVVVMADDIQWADDASAQFIHYLARQAASRPLLLVCAYRDEELDSQERLAGLVGSLRREAHARHVPLARLRVSDAEALVERLADPKLQVPGLAARLHRETDGNPFFLMSMLHSLTQGEAPVDLSGELPLPDALRASVRARLVHVDADARAVLDIAAVLGRRFDFETLLAVTRKPEEDLLTALEALVRRRLLREASEDGFYDFSHDKVREVVYREIVGARRKAMHRAVAEALEPRTDLAAHERDAWLAEHYERAQVWRKALQYVLLAAERSQKLFAMRDALHWLDRAVALAESHPDAIAAESLVALYGRRGAARALAGQTEGAVADIRRVIDEARLRSDRARARDAFIQLGMAYRRADDYSRATQCLAEALLESRAMNDERYAADTLYHLGTVMWSNGRNHEAITFHQEAVEICERMGLKDLVAVQAYHGRGEAHYTNLEPAAAIELLRALDRACARHRRPQLRVREPDDDRVRLHRLHGARRLRARREQLPGVARHRARRGPAVAPGAHAAGSRPHPRMRRPLRRGVRRDDEDAALAGEREADSLPAHRLRPPWPPAGRHRPRSRSRGAVRAGHRAGHPRTHHLLAPAHGGDPRDRAAADGRPGRRPRARERRWRNAGGTAR